MKQDFKVYARLLSYLKPYWGAALLVLVGFGINASTEVSVAKLLEYIINAIQHQNQQNLNWFPFLVIILIFSVDWGYLLAATIQPSSHVV